MAEESVVQETGVDSDKAAAAEKQKKATKKQSRKAAKPAETAEQNKERMLFEKYSYDVKVEDLSLKRYIDLTPLEYPSTFRRRSQKDLSKATLNIVERLENSMMRGGTGGRVGGKTIRTEGRLQGKKIKVMHIIEKAFDAIHEKSGANPLQLYVKALEEQRADRGHDQSEVRRHNFQCGCGHKRQQEAGHSAEEYRNGDSDRILRQEEKDV
jgi:Ribosomal protein S7